ncbi:HNH endonuclease [Streptomyces luteocolor]
MSPSLDHVIPLSRGGSHRRDNVQLAHLRCNLRKNNRFEVAEGG